MIRKVTKMSVIKDSNTVIVRVKVLPGGKMPEKKTAGAAAFDLYARIGKDVKNAVRSPRLEHEDYLWFIRPLNFRSVLVPLGIALEMPLGVCAFILPRSSTALKTQLLVHTGLIDSDYRGEINAIVRGIDSDWDTGSTLFGENTIVNGERFAQLVFNVPNVKLVQVDELSKTERGDEGFGSTGK